MSKIEDVVREKYGAVAASDLTGAHAGVRAVAEAFGYSAEELDAIPAEANMGLSCGNPTVTANLRPGEVVVDLGSGGGIDVFLAAKKVGPAGRAIGIDMTPEMIERARTNATRAGVENAEFRLGTIDQLPLENDSVDCLISNCVINLAPNKLAVFREMFRVLKPGGRVAVSDIALKRALPDELAKSVAAHVGCVAGAVPIADYERDLRAAGFEAVRVIETGSDLNAYKKVENQSTCCAPQGATSSTGLLMADECGPGAPGSDVHTDLVDLLRKYDVNEFAASVRVYAVKGRGNA
ncbi:sam-dependent methyltransferase : Methylase involved in ubiquinone/menaquinone biosynthesis OS=Terriglobus roseus (strain DSM 18391 / NRRL B-41598 / KBS 63) GN=Terro_0051 PE=4 SV=1: Methyltransf_31 [Gemmata massiliana]|uniref:Arsenite methyltransferase n=1 Tax=Gemmata massiliana TaxID=1210884 RepID=A0A6P2D270_9BACT|nr:arsenite methyltransferase [Gemmata massiliana]VTR95203.1 sam-dependent methyltransferase : Methylase involved in ubiquinone/menaquinone biosynthesis OS=Terriglobus roseus (strain DSM 18391 / NRRL B-41598 / KBS 63) GN=Terro_0051 PE=4 SV=1: Methyltransf_31 [Gemmata massiliana]